MILLSGELYYSLVTAFGVPAEEYGFKCGMVEAISHIKSVANAEDMPERYNPFLYFLVASAQGLNPSKSVLAEVPADFSADGIMKQQLQIRLRSFLQFQLGDIDTVEKEASPPTAPGVSTPQAVEFPPTVPQDGTPQTMAFPSAVAGVTFGWASRPSSISFTPTTRGRSVPTRNQAHSYQYTSTALRQSSFRSNSLRSSATSPARSAFAQSRIRQTPLLPPPPSLAVSTPPVVPLTAGLMSAAQSQQVMTQALLSIAQLQQEHQRRSDDYNNKTLLRLEQNDLKKASRESQLAGQTLEQRHLMHAVLTPDDAYVETPVFEFEELVFSDQMKALVDCKNPNNVLNQIRQITQDFKCSSNKALFFQFLRTQGCLPSDGMAVGGLTVFLMIPGYTIETAKELGLQHDINMREGEEGSYEAFRSLLGKANVVPPTNESEGLHMLQAMTDFLIRMADGPCMASSGYALAAELWDDYSQQIYKLTRSPQEPHFLLRLLSAIDMENYLLFKALFRDIQEAGKQPYHFRKELVERRDAEITQLFVNLERGRTSDLNLPDQFLSLLDSNQSKKGRGQGGGGGGGGDTVPPSKRMKITKEKGARNDQCKLSQDQWQAPASEADPIATYFSTQGNGKVSREQWMEIKFKHHRKTPGGDTFAETPLCLPFQVEGYCKDGSTCKSNHRSRKRMLDSGDATMKKNVLLIDKIVNATSL